MSDQPVYLDGAVYVGRYNLNPFMNKVLKTIKLTKLAITYSSLCLIIIK